MAQKNKGSQPPQGLLHITEAAQLLGLTTRTLSNYAKRGILIPVTLAPRGPMYFQQTSISALAALLNEGADMSNIAAIAMQAYVSSRATAKALEELHEYLGLRRTALEVTEEGVLSVYARAQAGVEDTSPLPPDVATLREWAAVFFAIDESYLQLVRRLTGSEEPWKVFVDLSVKLLNTKQMASLLEHPELKSALTYLRAASGNLRNVSYFSCRQLHGHSVAEEIFSDGKNDPTEIISALCFSH